MCYAKNCCYFVNLDTGCCILGAVSFIFSSFLAVTSTFSIVLLLRGPWNETGFEYQLQEIKILQMAFPRTAANIILGVTALVAVLLMIFSIFLLLGIRKNNPGMVLAYFCYGIVVTILALLSALLELLQTHWEIALFTIVASMLYIHCLVVVHTTYDLMQRGKVFGNNNHERLEDDPFLNTEIE